MRENAFCMVFHVIWISHHSSLNPTLVATRLGQDSETRGEKNPSHMENHTKCISWTADEGYGLYRTIASRHVASARHVSLSRSAIAHSEAPPSASGAHYRHGLIGCELWNHYIPAEKLIKPTQFWHISIIKVSLNCDLPSRNEIFLTNQ